MSKVNAMRECSTNCPTCPGTEEYKKNCPDWVLVKIASDIFKDLRRIQGIMSQAMINDLRMEAKNEIMEEDDDLEEPYEKAERDLSHNRFFN